MKNKTVLVWEYGTFFNIAKRLSREFKTVYHHTPRPSNFPTINTEKIGDGYPNIVACSEDDAWRLMHEVDLIVFPDIGDGGLQKFLRKKGYRVFGTEMGEKIEGDRSYFKEEIKKLGLNVNKYEVFTDVDKLREYLIANDDRYIKISYYRGLAESFHHKTWKDTEEWWTRLSLNLGVYRHNFQEIVVEEPIECKVEIGTDRFFSNKQFLDLALQGIEIKNAGYICKAVTEDKIPTLLRDIDNKVAALYRKYDIRSAISTEIRVPKQGVGYFIDSTQRFGYPPSTTMCCMFGNLGEMMYRMAGNEPVDGVLDYRYGAELIMYSEELKENWVHVDYPKQYDENVYLQASCLINGKHYCIPNDGSDVIGSIVCGADTLDEAIQDCLDVAEEVEACGLRYDKDAFDKAKEQLKIANKLNVGFS